ncbi:MAG: NAD-glutamate dehydrogenase domain-containing protein, partial [Pseudomonadota bacterium]
DYDPKALSKGGGIFPRDQKSITLSKAAAAAIGLTKTKVSPTEVMQAILKAEAELMWFGGIGTYIRASHETDAEVGDRANDPIRINAKQVRAKVIGEGANLGLTQHARIEFGKLGGRCNSDAIDNSGGVNSSDVEVNIKIAFAPALRDNRLTRAARNKLLVQMTDEVADLVLRNNYAQTLTISRTQNAGIQNLALQAQLMKSLESRNLLDRGVEMLPSDEEIAERLADQKGLTRAEVGVLLSYAKIVLFDDLVQSGLPDDPYLEEDLLGYFPSKMHTAFRENIAAHRLRREIIATVIANELINRGGPSVISRFEDASGALPSEIAHAHVIVRDAYGIPEIEKAIDALDNKISGSKQLELYEELANANRVAISRYLKDGNSAKSLRDEIEKLSSAFTVMKSRAKGFLPEYLLSWSENRKRAFAAAGMEKSAAASLGLLPILASAPAILTIAEEAAQPLEIEQAAAAYHAITKAFRLGRLEHLAQMIDVTDYFDGLAQTRALSAIDSAHVAMTRAALGQAETGEADMTELVNAWVDENSDRIAAVQKRIATIMETSSELSVSRLTVAAGLLSDLV